MPRTITKHIYQNWKKCIIHFDNIFKFKLRIMIIKINRFIHTQNVFKPNIKSNAFHLPFFSWLIIFPTHKKTNKQIFINFTFIIITVVVLFSFIKFHGKNKKNYNSNNNTNITTNINKFTIHIFLRTQTKQQKQKKKCSSIHFFFVMKQHRVLVWIVL